jgi:hypothetical protein
MPLKWLKSIDAALLVLTLSVAPLSFAADTQGDAEAVRKLLADAADIGLPAGALAPPFTLTDQAGRRQDLASLTGPKGLVVVFFRSADW